MSGIEVIGLLLGIFPLAISAVEHHRDSHRALSILGVQSIAHFEREYRKQLENAKDEQLFFRQTLETLFFPFIDEDDLKENVLEEFLAKLECGAEDAQEIETQIRHRLGSAYARFMEIAASLSDLISRLLSMVVKGRPLLEKRVSDFVHPSQKLSCKALHAFLQKKWRYQKIQSEFGYGKAQRDDILKQVREYNAKLESILRKSDSLALHNPPATVRISSRAVLSLLRYRSHADTVYTLIDHSWGCSCKDHHCAYLWLRHPDSADFELELLVLWAPISTVQGLPPWDRQALRIIKSSTNGGEPKATGDSPEPGRTPGQEHGVLTTERRKRRRVGIGRVWFHAHGGKSKTDSTAETKPCEAEARVPSDTADEANVPNAEILGLCRLMSICGMQAACIAADETTLQDILHGRETRLRLADRFKIALAVASSHRQLQPTRWARKQWEAKDIRFPKTSGEHPEIFFDKPYVFADFKDMLQSSQKITKPTDRSFAYLGIILLELLFESCLEENAAWDELGFVNHKADDRMRLIVAQQWSNPVEDEAGELFDSATKWCLNDSPPTLSGEQWRKDLADRVVSPIHRCCDWIKAKPGD